MEQPDLNDKTDEELIAEVQRRLPGLWNVGVLAARDMEYWDEELAKGNIGSFTYGSATSDSYSEWDRGGYLHSWLSKYSRELEEGVEGVREKLVEKLEEMDKLTESGCRFNPVVEYRLQAKYLDGEWGGEMVNKETFPTVEAAEEQIKVEQEFDKKNLVTGFEYRVIPSHGGYDG